MAFTKYPITDYNNLNLDWLVEQTRENTDNIDLNASGLASEILTRAGDDAAERQARINADQNLQNQINVLSPVNVTDYVAINKRSLPGQILLIGDSYLEGWTPDGHVTDWGTALATLLDKTVGTDLFKYARGGSGLVAANAGRTFRSLLAEAAQDPAITAGKVTYIIAGGGWNDHSHSAGEIADAASAFYADAKTLYPNAIVYVANMGYAPGASYSVFQKNNVSDGYGRRNALGDLWTVLAAYPELYLSSDGIHPNSAGSAALARAVYDVLFTGRYNGDDLGPYNVSSGQVNMVLYEYIRNHTLFLTHYTNGAGATISFSSLTSGQANGQTKAFSVTGLPFNAANYTRFIVPCLYLVNNVYVQGQMIIRPNGRDLDFYPLCLRAGTINWQALSGITECYLQPFTISTPLTTL